MSETKKRYDRKYKNTRIILADYLVLKKLSIQAGISMAEALHKLITRQLEPSAEEIAPLLAYLTRGPIRTSTRGSIKSSTRSSTAIATDGGRVAAFRIKHGGIRHE